MVPRAIPVDERTVEELILEVEGQEAVVADNRGVMVEVASVDVARVKCGSQAKVEVPLFLAK